VAALGNGNDTVILIDAVDACRVRPEIAHGVDHTHGIVPVPERGHDQGVGYDHADAYHHVNAKSV